VFKLAIEWMKKLVFTKVMEQKRRELFVFAHQYEFSALALK
jgi:hypothetical protein